MKILIIRFSSIGDIILTTPVIRCLKNQLEDVEIHYLTKSIYTELLNHNPYIDRLWTIEKSIREVEPQLKKEKFDYIADLHKNWRSLAIQLMLLKKAHSFPKLNFKKWLLVQFKVNLLPDVHIVNRYFHAVEALQVINDNKGLDLFIPEDNTALEKFNLKQGEYIVVGLGGKFGTKKYPPDLWGQVLANIEEPKILLGGDSEKEEATLITNTTHAIDATGQTTLLESAALVRAAKKVITHDTGIMHIAAAFGKEIISIWGSTVPEFGMYPYFGDKQGKSVILEVKGLDCRPCSKLGFDKCPRSHFKCMRELKPEKIVSSVYRLHQR